MNDSVSLTNAAKSQDLLMDSHQLRELLEQRRRSRLEAYEKHPQFILQDHGNERSTLAGGYGYRQILELVQNGADAILEAEEKGKKHQDAGRIEVQLHSSKLYVANTGAPLTKDGVDALLHSYISRKRGNQIGRFGIGFKSLLALKGHIDILTRSAGCIHFDPERCRGELSAKFGVSKEEAPGLALAWWHESRQVHANDPALASFGWAETVVRADVATSSMYERLAEEMEKFPAEFLLFFEAPVSLHLDNGKGEPRSLKIVRRHGESILSYNTEESRWLVSFCGGKRGLTNR